MAGTKEGGKKAYLTFIQRYGVDAWSYQASRGGRNSHGSRFSTDRAFAAEMGRKGGRKSKRPTRT